MDIKNLDTYAKNTWCPGCGNFSILNSIKSVISELSGQIPIENFVIVSGIGCHAKIVDYINVNSFYSLHGRAVPAAEGIKIANPRLKVIVFAGDGDAYGEGLEHLIFAAKRNIDITVIVHNNRVYGLTVGQCTPTSPLGFKGKSTPAGTVEIPFNPLHLLLSSGATFIARGYTHGIDLLKDIFKQAVLHKGFSIVDTLQVCVSFYNMYDYYSKRVYTLKDHNIYDYQSALNKIKEWDYNTDSPISLGVFYKKETATFEENIVKNKNDVSGQRNISKIINERQEIIKKILASLT
ncbi:MAG: thiamine pyrophosphate-dependent enzyme [Candidatus Omnitrophica bacterium]|nr:thiamine pyrophosphate-dependent enzyme [Candidatus Omnitrophota bacterium]